MAKISKNARTDRKSSEGSKDNVKIIVPVKVGNAYRFKEVVMHKDKVKDYIDNL